MLPNYAAPNSKKHTFPPDASMDPIRFNWRKSSAAGCPLFDPLTRKNFYTTCCWFVGVDRGQKLENQVLRMFPLKKLGIGKPTTVNRLFRQFGEDSRAVFCNSDAVFVLGGQTAVDRFHRPAISHHLCFWCTHIDHRLNRKCHARL